MSDLETKLLQLLDSPMQVVAVAAALVLLLLLLVYREQAAFYARFIAKSLSRNKLRTILTSLATMVFVLVVILIWSVFSFLDRVTSEKSKDFKVIVTERWQIPSQMPFAYANTLADGAATEPGDYKVNTSNDSMTWQFYGGTLDAAKQTRENVLFFFGMEPDKLLKMMDGVEEFTAEQRVEIENACQAMIQDPRRVIIGADRLKLLNKKVGDRVTVTSFNYKDINLEVEIIAEAPPGRFGQSGFLNRAYLNRALDDYERQRGVKHPMANKTLNLVWLRVPDTTTFQKVADQIENRGLFTSPNVKVETASSGIASFLEGYRGFLWVMRYLVVPAIIFTMALIIATAISISVRERRSEMAVLKVLGFSPGQVMSLVLGEAVMVGVMCGVVVGLGAWYVVNQYFGGVNFPIAFFPAFKIPIDAVWWGAAIGAITGIVGSIMPALSARKVKVAEVFSKVA